MGAVASNAVTYAGMFIPDREKLVEWGVLDADEERAMKASKDTAAKQQRKLKKEMKPLYKALNLRERDMEAFYEAYGDVDIDGILSISYSNFCEFFHIIPNRFIEAMFFDFNPEKNMTFQHFLVSTFYYCMATPKELSKMIFTVYDRAQMGKIYPHTVMQLVREMYDKGFRFEPQATMAVVKLINTHEKQWGVDEAAFVEILWKHQQPGERKHLFLCCGSPGSLALISHLSLITTPLYRPSPAPPSLLSHPPLTPSSPLPRPLNMHHSNRSAKRPQTTSPQRSVLEEMRQKPTHH